MMCAQRRLWSTCAPAQSNQGLRNALWVAKNPKHIQDDCEDRSDLADAQADLSLRWAHLPSSRKCCGPVLCLYENSRIQYLSSWRHVSPICQDWYFLFAKSFPICQNISYFPRHLKSSWLDSGNADSDLRCSSAVITIWVYSKTSFFSGVVLFFFFFFFFFWLIFWLSIQMSNKSEWHFLNYIPSIKSSEKM